MKWKLVGLAIIIAIIGGGVLYVRGIDYSEGFRVGVIQKLSKKGFIFKTYEGELILDGLTLQNSAVTRANPGTPALTTVWKFSVTNGKMAKELERLVGAGKTHVSLHYVEHYPNFTFISETPYHINRVAEVK
jgi:hypothetical protein